MLSDYFWTNEHLQENLVDTDYDRHCKNLHHRPDNFTEEDYKIYLTEIYEEILVEKNWSKNDNVECYGHYITKTGQTIGVCILYATNGCLTICSDQV